MLLNRKTKVGIAGFLAGVITLSSIPVAVSADTTAFDGDFSSGGFSIWDGETYDFSWYVPGVDEYTISSAEQFASLAILTNDLSSADYADYVATLKNIPAEYIPLVDTFERKTIKLNVNVDLAGYDWLPIAYPWNTPNVTNDKYKATEHIPDVTSVDSWVGDASGRKISTRYYEFPEAEMRFRDLLYGVNFSGDINGFTEMMPGRMPDHRYNISIVKSYGYDHGKMSYDYGFMNYMAIYRSGIFTEINGSQIEWVLTDTQQADYPDKVPQLRELTSTDIIASHTYDDIVAYADTDGFMGTFDGGNNRIKNIHPVTPWTDDPEERLHTYDPIGKGLFGYLGKTGEIKNLNVKGEYTASDVVSYSAILCAYNYGTITNCYVHGDMEQGLVTSIYPKKRDYGPNGTSTYVLSDTPGTVLPVGNSGFVSAINEGTIDGCVTAGEVTQAYRQFGFMACINNGTIKNSVNRAKFSTKQIETDFMTDEWSYTYDLTSKGLDIENSAYSEIRTYVQNNAGNIDAYYADKGAVLRQFDTTVLDWNDILWVGGGRDNFYDGYISAAMQGSLSDGTPWIPQLYETEDGESVAANHLYGVYGYTAVGGICAVNNGDVIDCTNEGAINVMHNTSTRQIGNRYNELPEGSRPDDYYNYIRPANAYGIFSTQAETMNIASGIAALNQGLISGCFNLGSIIEREITDRDKIHHEDGGYAKITYTPNGFYANDSIVYEGTSTYKYNPLGIRWWWTPENQILTYTRDLSGDLQTDAEPPEDPYDGMVYRFAPDDSNMPYPLFRKSFVAKPDELTENFSATIFSDTAMIQLAAGICSNNAGEIINTENSGYARNGITHVSDGRYNTVNITNVSQNASSDYNIGYYLRNTNIENANVTNTAGKYGIAYIAEAEGFPVTQNNISVYEGASGYYKLYADTNRMTASNIRLYDDSLSGVGIAVYALNTDFENIANFQNSENGLCGEVVNCNIKNTYVYGDAVKNGIGAGTIYDEITNCYFFGLSAEYALGDFKYGKYTDLGVYSIDTSGNLGMSNHILKATEADIKNLNAFINTDSRILDMKSCSVNDAVVYGDTPKITTDADYRYLFEYCNCANMILQTNIDIEWKNPNTTAGVQSLPGVLKGYSDTNTFTDCVIQTPNGAVSYPTFNYQVDEDTTIKSDALLIYDTNARVSGALAYQMDNGSSENRTYDYTVAAGDIINILDGTTNFIETDKVRLIRERSIPAHTRKKKSDSERSFYRLAIPFTSNGAGEVIGSVTRDGETYATAAYEEIFPTTNIYLYKGETAELSVVEQPGFGLEKIEKVVNGKTEELKYKEGETIEIKMPEADVTILSYWSGLYTIEVQDNPDVTIVPSTAASAAGHTVYVDTLLNREDASVSSVWYYMYETDESNRPVLDTSEKIEIDMSSMSFVMPNADIKIFAEIANTDVSVTEFVLAGVRGVVDNELRTITVSIPGNTNLVNIAPDVFRTNGAKSINPDISILRDFTKPVTYILTAEDDTEIKYTVSVVGIEDGYISYFEVLGKVGEINQDSGTISLEISDDIDLTNVKPYIIWSGASISEEGYIDLSSGSYTYIVTSSDGTTKVYTVIVTAPDSESALQDIHIAVPDTEGIIWQIDDSKLTITATFPYGAELSEAIIEVLDWYGMSTNLREGESINLTRSNYLVIKEDSGRTLTYAIIAKEAPFDAKAINQFTIYGYDGVIDEENKTITLTIPKKYDITNIQPDVIGFTAKEVIGVYEKQDFTKPVTYIVNAYDGTSVSYTVIVNRI